MPAVELVEYQRAWPGTFRVISDELSAAMPGLAVTVEHIGSTAVPGLCAKRVIDVLLGVDDLSDVVASVGALRELGYRYRPEYEIQIPERRYLVKEASGAIPRVHVHAVQLEGQLWREHIAFRNALRENLKLREQYAGLKRELAKTLDKAAYTDAKAPFILGVLKAIGSGNAPSAA